MSATTALAFRSLRYRPTAVTATFLAALLGTVLMGSFATLVESAMPAGPADQELLIAIGCVVGSWSALIVLFSIASTVGITATQQARELGLLRTIGATPRQARGIILRETLVVALVGAVIGSSVAWVTGRLLFDALSEGGLLTPAAEYSGGVTSLSSAVGAVVLVSMLAAWIAAHRATRGPAILTLHDADTDAQRMTWWRVLGGALLLGIAIAMVVLTVTIGRATDDARVAMITAGSASILVALGFGTLSPLLLRVFAAPMRALLGRSSSHYLAAYSVTRRSHMLSGVLAPVVVLVAATTGTLLMVGIDDRTMAANGDPTGAGGTVTLVNYIVTAMICLFAAVMVVNSFAAVVAHRRTELGRLWLLGATRTQVRRAIVSEAVIVAVVGTILGTLASTSTFVSYAVAREEGIVPNGEMWLPVVVATGAALLALAAAWAAVRRAVR
jgi:putative ABC transport system permease protein